MALGAREGTVQKSPLRVDLLSCPSATRCEMRRMHEPSKEGRTRS